jgi:hypothetical protein
MNLVCNRYHHSIARQSHRKYEARPMIDFYFTRPTSCLHSLLVKVSKVPTCHGLSVCSDQGGSLDVKSNYQSSRHRVRGLYAAMESANLFKAPGDKTLSAFACMYRSVFRKTYIVKSILSSSSSSTLGPPYGLTFAPNGPAAEMPRMAGISRYPN